MERDVDTLMTESTLGEQVFFISSEMAEYREKFTHEDFITSIQSSPTNTVSLYIHIPFCQSMCYSCATNKVISHDISGAAEYINYIAREVNAKSLLFGDKKISSIHFGGGTPNFLTEPQIVNVIWILSRHFSFLPDVDMSIEVDPRTITEGKLLLLSKAGFNRVSFGVHDVNDDVLRAINRVQDETILQALIDYCKKIGFQSINVDLVYGLPLQTKRSFDQTMAKIIAMDPSRVTFIEYLHCPAEYAAQKKLEKYSRPTTLERTNLLVAASVLLNGAGYKSIGIDHFAKEEDPLAIAFNDRKLRRNARGYDVDHNTDTVGLGVSAISDIGGDYFHNYKELQQYYTNVTESEFGIKQTLKTTVDDRIRRDVKMNLLCYFDLAFADINAKHKISFLDYFAPEIVALQQIEQDGNICISAWGIEVKGDGRQLIARVCRVFDVGIRDSVIMSPERNEE